MGFHIEGDCKTCLGIGSIVDDDDKEAMYEEAARMIDKDGFKSLAMAIKDLHERRRYRFHTCPVCNGTGISNENDD